MSKAIDDMRNNVERGDFQDSRLAEIKDSKSIENLKRMYSIKLEDVHIS